MIPDINWRWPDDSHKPWGERRKSILQVFHCNSFTHIRVHPVELALNPTTGDFRFIAYNCGHLFGKNTPNAVSRRLPYRRPRPYIPTPVPFYPPTEVLTMFQTTQSRQPAPWRDQPPHLANLAAIALDTYTNWLRHVTSDMPDLGYTPIQFTDGDYANLILLAHYNTTDHEVLVLIPEDGDDGGSATITAYFHEGYDDNPPELRLLIQEFDTDVHVIYQDGAFQ